jgi:uncharacterized protein (TIGR03435 family)
MYRRLARRFGICLLAAAGVGRAQVSPAAPVAFEVAAIRPSPPITELFQQIQSGKAKLGMNVDGSRVDIGFVSLADLVGLAYNLKPYQVQGPAWMSLQRFDIQAKIPEGVSKDKVSEMLQALLAERFKMTTHKEKKDQPVYALIVGKNGAKLIEAAPEPEKIPVNSTPGSNGAAQMGQFKFTANGQNGVVMQTGNVRTTAGPNGSHLEISRTTMPAFANLVSSYVDRPVIDMTGLPGEYQVALDLSPEDMRLAAQRAQQMLAQLGLPLPAQQPPGANSGDPSNPGGGSVSTALDKLGLKLDARKAPLDVMVIDHLEKNPTGN